MPLGHQRDRFARADGGNERGAARVRRGESAGRAPYFAITATGPNQSDRPLAFVVAACTS